MAMTQPRMYKATTGLYKGKYHVRHFKDGKYLHIGRFNTKRDAEQAIKNYLATKPMELKAQSETQVARLSRIYGGVR